MEKIKVRAYQCGSKLREAKQLIVFNYKAGDTLEHVVQNSDQISTIDQLTKLFPTGLVAVWRKKNALVTK